MGSATSTVPEAVALLEEYLQKEPHFHSPLDQHRDRVAKSCVVAATVDQLMRRLWVGSSPRLPPLKQVCSEIWEGQTGCKGDIR